MESFRSSYHHNKSMKGDPMGRIVVTGPRILYRNREYNSASNALLDYISEFQGTQSKFNQSVHVPFSSSSDVLDLLTTHSAHNNSIPVQTDASNTSQISYTLKRGLRLSDFDSSGNGSSVKKVIDDSYRRMKQVDGAMQVADALNKSHDVLKKVDEDRLSDIGPSVGDIQSLETESLISFNPFNSVSNNVLSEGPRRHIYSYRTPRPRSHTVSEFSLDIPNQELLNTASHQNHSATSHKQLSSSLPKPNFLMGRYGRRDHVKGTIDEKLRYRSRSVSPGFESDKSNYQGKPFQPPHWAEGHNSSKSSKQISDIRDLKGKLGGRQTPSWIEDIVGSSASSIVLSDQPGMFLHQEDISSVSGHSDPTSLSTSVPSLRLADFEPLRESKGRTNNNRRRHVKGHIQTSTPMKKSLPSRFDCGKDVKCDTVPGNLTPNNPNTEIIDHGLVTLTAELGDTSQPIYNSNNTKIDHMLRELDVMRQKLKSSSDDTHHCLSDLTPKRVATNLRNKLKVNGQMKPPNCDQSYSSIDLEKPLYATADMNLAVSSITKDLDQATRTLSISDDVSHNVCESTVTDEILQGDRVWEKTPALKFQVGSVQDKQSTRGVIRDFMDDCLQEDQPQHETPIPDTLTGGEQPGSMEALKNMLFKLQFEASSVNNNPAYELPSSKQTVPPKETHQIEVETVSSMSDTRRLEDYNFQAEPGGQCLERALVHLSRLQSLVQSETFNPESRGNSAIQASSCLDT